MRTFDECKSVPSWQRHLEQHGKVLPQVALFVLGLVMPTAPALAYGLSTFKIVCLVSGCVWAICVAATDLKSCRIPDVLTLPLGAGLACSLLCGSVGLEGLAVFVWPGIYMLVAVTVGGVGGGDIKLALVLSLWLLSPVAILGACVLATLLQVVSQVAGRRARQPHAPAMLIAAVVSAWGLLVLPIG